MYEELGSRECNIVSIPGLRFGQARLWRQGPNSKHSLHSRAFSTSTCWNVVQCRETRCPISELTPTSKGTADIAEATTVDNHILIIWPAAGLRVRARENDVGAEGRLLGLGW